MVFKSEFHIYRLLGQCWSLDSRLQKKLRVEYENMGIFRSFSRFNKNSISRFAFQFAAMASAFTTAWIFIRIFPILIRNTSNLYVYGYDRLCFLTSIFLRVITILVELNALSNATIHLISNREVSVYLIWLRNPFKIQQSIQTMIGHSNSIVINAISKEIASRWEKKDIYVVYHDKTYDKKMLPILNNHSSQIY